MQHCQFCGAEFPENVRFCGNCGQPAVSMAGRARDPFPPVLTPPVTFPPPPPGNQPSGEEEEKCRREALLPLPILPGVQGPFASGQIPQLQGTPSITSMPAIQGTPGTPAGSVAPPSPPAGTAAPVPATDPITGHAPGVAVKTTLGGTTKIILIAVSGLLVVAGGVSALVLATRTHSPGPAGTRPAAAGKSTPLHPNASATACAQAKGGSRSGTTTPTPAGATGAFRVTGSLSGPLVITSPPKCGTQGSAYVMQVTGTVNRRQEKLLIGILSYHGPGTYTSHLTVNLLNGKPFPADDDLTNDGRWPVTITITNAGKARTVSSDLEGILNGTQIATGHVSGSWTCA